MELEQLKVIVTGGASGLGLRVEGAFAPRPVEGCEDGVGVAGLGQDRSRRVHR